MMKTSINKMSDNSIQIYQSTPYAKNGRNKWDRQAVYLDQKMIDKIIKLNKEKQKIIKRDNFGVAEFKVVCEPQKVSLIIHDNHIVAKTNNDVYEAIFDYVVSIMGGRTDGLK